jgi:heme exporter protein A
LTERAAPAVESQGLWKRYRGTWALRDVNVVIPAGQCVCLVGPNGAGKTTLLRIMATATGASRGDVRVFGNSVNTDADAVRRRIGLFVAQSYLYGELTPVENLRFAAIMYDLSYSETDLRDRLARAGLARAADARVRTFSQGMLQRLALARAMLHEADVMLLDEPYTALDTAGLRLVDELLRSLRAAGRTVIMATHALERALDHCDRGIALDAGRVVYDGAPDRLLEIVDTHGAER